MKKEATKTAHDRDAQIQKELDELATLRNDIVARGNILVGQAERLSAILVMEERFEDDFKNNYCGLEALRQEVVKHVHISCDCKDVYLKVLDLSSTIFNKGYDERWNWAIALKGEKEKILSRRNEVVFKTKKVKKYVKDILKCDETSFEDRIEALRRLKHNYKNYINNAQDQVRQKGKLIITHVKAYSDVKLEESVLHAKQLALSDKMRSKKRVISQVEADTVNNEVNADVNKAKIVIEHSKIVEALKVIQSCANEIKRLDPSVKRFDPVFYSIYSDPDMLNKAPEPILLEIKKTSTSLKYQEYMKSMFESLFGCDESKEILKVKKFRHKQDNNL